MELEEKKGKIHWLCHKCAPTPCPFEGETSRKIPLEEHYRLQYIYIQTVVNALLSTPPEKLTVEQRERLEGNRKVAREIDRRIELLAKKT